MSERSVWRLRGRIIDCPQGSAEEMQEFAAALTEASGYQVFPGSVRLQASEPVKLRPEKVVDLGVQRRMVVPAKVNQYPVIISHQWPLKPPLSQKLLIFADVDLLDQLELDIGSMVRLEISREYIARAHVWDWAKSLSNVLDSGIDR